MQRGETDLSLCAVPTRSVFHIEKVGIYRTVKWGLHGTGAEQFSEDACFSEGQNVNFANYGRKRRNRTFWVNTA